LKTSIHIRLKFKLKTQHWMSCNY